MTPDTRCVLCFRRRPICIADRREELNEFIADRYANAPIEDMEITEMVPILKASH